MIPDEGEEQRGSRDGGKDGQGLMSEGGTIILSHNVELCTRATDFGTKIGLLNKTSHLFHLSENSVSCEQRQRQ